MDAGVQKWVMHRDLSSTLDDDVDGDAWMSDVGVGLIWMVMWMRMLAEMGDGSRWVEYWARDEWSTSPLLSPSSSSSSSSCSSGATSSGFLFFLFFFTSLVSSSS